MALLETVGMLAVGVFFMLANTCLVSSFFCKYVRHGPHVFGNLL